MRTILGLIGSPRKLGNSELAVKHVARMAPFEHRLVLCRVTDHDLKPCLGCYNCLAQGGRCVLEDDAPKIFEALIAADYVLVGAPTYFLGAYAALKRLVDRGNMILPRAAETDGKPGAVLTLAGVPGREGRAPAELVGSAMALGLTVKAHHTFYAALPGEVLIDPACQQAAAAVAAALFTDRAAPAPDSPACPVCGSNAYAFSGDRVKCLVCQGQGPLELTPAGPRPRIAPDTEGFLVSRAWRLHHVEWLKGMKARFIEQKAALKAAVTDYRHDGEWLL